MSDLQLSEQSLQQPEAIHEFLLETIGISAQVKLVEGRPTIKVDHHLSLATLVAKLRHEFNFQVYHPAGTDEYVVYLMI
jgi:hypothetical protein